MTDDSRPSAQPSGPVPMTRRELLEAFAVLVAGGMLGAVPAACTRIGEAPLNAKDLGGLGHLLTGYSIPDDDVLANFLDALARRYGRGDLARLADVVAGHAGGDVDSAIESAGLGEVANGVVAALYTGTVTDPAGEVRVVTYVDALAWRACTFTKPPSECGGVTGYWEKPPASGTA